MFLDIVAGLMFTFGCMGIGCMFGMQISESLQRKASAADTKDEEVEA
ncbi:MAG TPA: hypothetical protein PKN33_21005 [Phycisphaerae bacterium]|nr:hypothetical protein [Phycisphaerae bacterium]